MIKFFKSWGYVLMAFVFSIMSVFSSFASLATASDATMSDAVYADDVYDLDEAYFLVDDDPYSIESYSDTPPVNFVIEADVVDSNNKFIKNVAATYTGRTSTYYHYKWPTLPSGQYYNNIKYRIVKKYLPTAGTYGFKATISPYNLGLDLSTAQVAVFTYKSGVLSDSSAAYASLNGYTATANVQLGYNTSLVLCYFWLKSKTDVIDVQIPVNEPYGFTFKKQTGNTVTSPDVGNGSSSAADAVAGNTSQIAQNTASMNDTLKEIVQTISKQLEALWNQMYNYIHLEDMANADKNADKIVDALQNGLTVEIENDDRNTETITNGYDKGSIDKSNSDLNDSLSGYESAESAASDDAMGYIRDFEYPDLESELGKTHASDCIGIIADLMQQFFVAMGALSLPVTVSFTLIFVTMLLGYHRFRN